MKLFLSVLFFNTFCFSQITPTPEQAKEYLLFLASLDIREYEQSDNIYLLLENHNNGDIVVNNDDIYEIFTKNEIPVYSAGYIYLDGKNLSSGQINDVRKKIIQKFNSGVSFKDLVAEYNMDKNPDAANLQFSDGEMVYEFENAVKTHNTGQIFTVDVPDKQWYYIAIRNSEVYSKKVIRVRYAKYPQ